MSQSFFTGLNTNNNGREVPIDAVIWRCNGYIWNVVFDLERKGNSHLV